MKKLSYDLKAQIAEEKKAIIQQMFADLWDEANEQGIEPELIAEILVENSIRELVTKYGDGETGRMLTRLQKLDEHGAFLPQITLQ